MHRHVYGHVSINMCMDMCAQTRVWRCAHRHVYGHVRTDMCMDMCAQTCVRTCAHRHVYGHMRACACTCACMCVCVCMHALKLDVCFCMPPASVELERYVRMRDVAACTKRDRSPSLSSIVPGPTLLNMANTTGYGQHDWIRPTRLDTASTTGYGQHY